MFNVCARMGLGPKLKAQRNGSTFRCAQRSFVSSPLSTEGEAHAALPIRSDGRDTKLYMLFVRPPLCCGKCHFICEWYPLSRQVNTPSLGATAHCPPSLLKPRSSHESINILCDNNAIAYRST